MVIPEKLIKKWKALRTPGDGGKMSEKASAQGLEISDETFNRSFRNGKCSDDTFKIMAEFYEEKAQLIKQYV